MERGRVRGTGGLNGGCCLHSKGGHGILPGDRGLPCPDSCKDSCHIWGGGCCEQSYLRKAEPPQRDPESLASSFRTKGCDPISGQQVGKKNQDCRQCKTQGRSPVCACLSLPLPMHMPVSRPMVHPPPPPSTVEAKGSGKKCAASLGSVGSPVQ